MLERVDTNDKSQDEYLHWALLLGEGGLGLLPLQRLHALQVARHQGAAVLRERKIAKDCFKKRKFAKDSCQIF